MSLLSPSIKSFQFFFFNDTATTEIYTTANTLSLHDALPICPGVLLIGLGIASWIAHPLPNVRRLIGFYAGAADRVHQELACGEREVADHLAIHAEARTPGQ